MGVKKYDMRFHWNDSTEASHRGTKTHIQNGRLVVWQLPHETENMFNERAKDLYSKKVRFLFNKLRFDTYTGIDENTFPDYLNEENKK